MDYISVKEVMFHENDFSSINYKKASGNEIIPIFGYVSCGEFKFADSDIEGYLEIPSRLIGDYQYFVLKAKGDSMIGVDINDGDIIIVQKQFFAEDGQIAVVMHEGEVVLKTFYKLPSEKKYLLHPENENYDDIIVEKCNILGVAVKIIKNI